MRVQATEKWRVYAISLGLTVLIAFALSFASDDESTVSRFYPILLCISGCLMASSIYRSWTRFGTASFFLLLPASGWEKFLAALLYCTLIFIPVFSLVYFFSAYFFLGISHPMSFYEMVTGGKSAILNWREFYMDTYLVYFLLLPFFMLSAARYRSYPFPAALLILAILFITYNYWQLFLLYNFSGGLAFGHTFFIRYGDFNYYVFPRGHYRTLTLDLVSPIRLLNVAAWAFLSLGLYGSAFYCLREREL
jgi:hypothetical protein